MIKPEVIRHRLDIALKREGQRSVTDEEWAYAQNQRWTDDDADEGTVAELVVNVVDARRTFGAKGPEKVEIAHLQRGVTEVQSICTLRSHRK